jgi:hypothetical protein
MSLFHMMLNPNLSEEFIIEQSRLQVQHVERLCAIVEKRAQEIEDPYKRMVYITQMMPTLIQATFL